MSSRFFSEQAGLALGAAAEAVWCGAAVAALLGASAFALIAFAWVVVLTAAVLAHRHSGREGGERRARLLAMAIVLAAVGVLLGVGRAWTRPYLPWWFVLAVLYSGALVALGLHLGSAPPWPETATRRAVRSFALLCAVLVTAALGGSTPPWAPWALVAALVLGALLVAVVRYRTLADVIDPAERLPAWPWLLSVVAAALVVIATGALLAEVLRAELVLWVLGVLATGVEDALAGLAFVVGAAGIELIRGIAWLAGALHLHSGHLTLHMKPVPILHARKQLLPPDRAPWHGSRVAAAVAGVAAAVGLSLALVVVALRRFRRVPPAHLMVLEEREALGSVRSAAGDLAALFARRLRRRLLRPRRMRPRTPAELVRRRYADLERRLARAGRPRPAGVTVRTHLAAFAASWADRQAPAVEPETARPSPAVPPPQPSPAAAAPAQPSPRAAPAALASAAELASIYEAARYSAHDIDAAQAGRFDALARAFTA